MPCLEYINIMKKKIVILTQPIGFSVSGIYGFRKIGKWLLNYVRPHYQRSIYGGHNAVTTSLIEGLKSLKVKYEINPLFITRKRSVDLAIVLADVKAAKQMIELKRLGYIKVLMVGPNLYNLPSDQPEISGSQYVDKILIPSQWTYDNYIKDMPSIQEKLAIWPAGVAINNFHNNQNNYKEIILYDKRSAFTNWDVDLSAYEKHLESLGYKVNLVAYGKYKKNEYLEALERSKFLIYISKWESQGIALQEAWERGVATLIYADPKIEAVCKGDRTVFAPYLNNECGALFSRMDDLEDLLNSLSASNVNPRMRAIELSNEISTTILLKHAGIIL